MISTYLIIRVRGAGYHKSHMPNLFSFVAPFCELEFNSSLTKLSSKKVIYNQISLIGCVSLKFFLKLCYLEKNDINVEEEIWILDIMKMSVPLIELLRVHLGTRYLAETENFLLKVL